MINNGKYNELIKYIKSLGKVVLAFSGGVDSTFLLKAAKEALGDNVKAVTIMSPYIPKWEIAEAKELEIKSPLLECKLTKSEIRAFSKELGLNTWDKPAYACLLTRIPYGNELKVEDFEKIENAEKYMMSIGFRAVRVRCHGDLARVEVSKNDRSKLFDEELLDTIAQKIKECGFKYVTLDLQGYRVGSFNETMMKNSEQNK